VCCSPTSPPQFAIHRYSTLCDQKKKKPGRRAGLLTLVFPRSRLRANLTANQSGSTWQDKGDKMAIRFKSNWCCSYITAGVEQFAGDGFPSPSLVPPLWNPKPVPPSPGLLFSLNPWVGGRSPSRGPPRGADLARETGVDLVAHGRRSLDLELLAQSAFPVRMPVA
jgi:hypothetical protein